MLQRLVCWSPSARFLRIFHGGMMLLWFVFPAPVLLVKGWKESVALLVFISIWANFAAHFAAFQGARAEERQGDDGPSC